MILTVAKKIYKGAFKMGWFFSDKCPNCGYTIKSEYCPNCGYYYKLYNELIETDLRTNNDIHESLKLARKYYEAGEKCYYKEEYQKAIEQYRMSASLGFADAIYSIGFMYRMGYGVQQNSQEAYKNFLVAANNGHTAANYQLGDMFYCGDIELNYEEAYKYLELAARNGHPMANYRMCSMYYHGLGVEINYKTSFEYLVIAAEKGEDEAQKVLSESYRFGQYGDLMMEENYEEAMKWIEQPAVNGDHEAEFWFGYFYRVHIEDYSIAFDWFYKSAKGGYAVAQLAVAGAYTAGSGVERDVEKSHYWYNKYLNNNSKGGSTQYLETSLEEALLLCYKDNDKREQRCREREAEFERIREQAYNTPITGDYASFTSDGYCIHEGHNSTCKFCSRRRWNYDDMCYEDGPHCRIYNY